MILFLSKIIFRLSTRDAHTNAKCHNIHGKRLWINAIFWQGCDNIGIVTGIDNSGKNSSLHSKRRIEPFFQLLITWFVSFCIKTVSQYLYNVLRILFMRLKVQCLYNVWNNVSLYLKENQI